MEPVATPDGHDPTESARCNVTAEMNLDVTGSFDRQFPLGGVKEERRNGQAKLPVQAVSPATGENADPSPHGVLPGNRRDDSVALDLDRGRSRVGSEIDTCVAGVRGQPRVERFAIDGNRFDRARAVDDVEA
jgi:hypothetical protein